jgi:predicted RNase H-like nuclease (RuvC/YqgF family)
MNKSLEVLERLKEETQPNAYTLNHNEEDFKTIKQDLERLEQLEKENQELKSKLSAIEFWNERYIEHNDKLEKALDKACEKFDFIYHCLLDAINDLDYVCPITLNFIDDLERENKCWKMYFLNIADVEVLE